MNMKRTLSETLWLIHSYLSAKIIDFHIVWNVATLCSEINDERLQAACRYAVLNNAYLPEARRMVAESHTEALKAEGRL
jgi:hypothetical protein